MNILVTGGAGYIGSATVEALVKAGHSVTVYDSLVTGHRRAVPEGAAFVEADLSDSHALAKALTDQKLDAVMHFAAYIEAGESMKDPGRFYHNNLTNSLALIETAVRAGVKRFVLSSTAAVYRSSEEPLREDSPLGPTNVYGHTKLMVEQALNWYREIHALHFAALRYFNAAGADPDGELGEDHSPEIHAIPRALDAAAGGEPFQIFGDDYPTPDGTCLRDYIHVSDLADAHVRALRRLEEGGTSATYNVGTERPSSVRDVVAAVEGVTRRAVACSTAPRRAGDPAVLFASAERIRTELGWTPRRPQLTTIVADAWRWHEAHPRGFRTLSTTG